LLRFLTRPRTIRASLFVLVLASVLPMAVFATGMVVRTREHQRAMLEESFRQVARGLALAVDHELSASLSVLGVLANADELDRGDLRAFYDEARRVLRARDAWTTVNLIDLSGQQLVNLYHPFGAPLPNSLEVPVVKAALDSGRPAISDLFVGPVAQQPLTGIALPVKRDGSLRYLLGAALDVRALTRVLSERELPEGAVAAIVDRQGVLIARTRALERWLGQPATPLFLAHTRANPEGSFESVTL
jgi:hypothetical protein